MTRHFILDNKMSKAQMDYYVDLFLAASAMATAICDKSPFSPPLNVRSAIQ